MAADLGSGPRAQELQVDTRTRGTEKRRSSIRRPRTRFSPQQLGALRAEFEKTMHPSWGTVLELTASTGLQEAVIQIWFKNQRARVRRQQSQSPPGPSPEAARQGSLGEEVLPSPTTSGETGFPSPGPWGAAAQELPAMSTSEPPAGPGASGYPCPLDILPPDLQDLCLLNGSCSPLGIDELAQVYGSPGGEDPANLEPYLVPSTEPDGDSGPDLPTAAQGPCPTTSANPGSPSPGPWGVDAQELLVLSSPEPHTGPGACGCPCPGEVLPPDLQDLCLQASHLPWACSPLGVDELAQAYGSPGGEDPAGLDQYLAPIPEPDGESGSDLSGAPPGPCPDRLHEPLLELLPSFAHTSEMNPVGTAGLEWLLGFQ